MRTNPALTVYNAAAGAGKTYTLVLRYITALLTGEFRDSYRNILALTFTNKAVAEMKSRILETLMGISKINTTSKYKEITAQLVLETGITAPEIQQKTNRLLKRILHNYAAFDVLTIDTFTHRVLRTFAHDLEIPVNFEIEMDTDALIEEAVAHVIAQIGIDETITKIIVDFALSKLENDKSWDISIELNSIAKLLFSENDRKHLALLSEKKPEDFDQLKKKLSKTIKDTKTTIIEKATGVLTLMSINELVAKDFFKGYIPAHFSKLASGELRIEFEKSKWKQEITTTDFYTKALDANKKMTIDEIRPHIETVFLETKDMVLKINLYENIVKNITPLSVLNTINTALQQLKKERKLILISEFNSIIHNTIREQPAPFIYERLGERYRDYFIDEFQDTSELQWNNMIPLMDNAVATETLSGKRGHVTIVGDAKQAIYRWRGGKAEQFIQLSETYTPFSVREKEVLNLPKNYRSHEEIIHFNNDLFTFLADDFSKDQYKQLYLQGNRQKTNTKKGGYVNVSFIEAKNVAEEHEIYPNKVYEIVTALIDKGYALQDICILTRRQKEGIVIADFLTEKGIPITSSETLLIHNAPAVRFIIDMLTWAIQPNNQIAKTNALHFIIKMHHISDAHTFLNTLVFANTQTFIEKIADLGVNFSFIQITTQPLYKAISYLITCFSLTDSNPLYLQFFLDTVFSFTQQKSGGIMSFLSYWERKKNTLSVVAPEGENAIRIMTIHKSKGLEFPCVIYPYATIDFYKEIEPKTWLPVTTQEFANFQEVLINYNTSIANYGADAQQIVLDRKAQLELDAFNVLYVALTRAEEQLYIVSKVVASKKDSLIANTFSGKLINYLKYLQKWDPNQFVYEFGMDSKPHVSNETIKHTTPKIELIPIDHTQEKYTITIVTNASKIWDTSRQTAIEKGNLLHHLMALIYTKEDITPVVEDAIIKGMLSIDESIIVQKELLAIVTHPELREYYQPHCTIFNEREITSQGRLYRPDRVILRNNDTIIRDAIIIDYKTGDSQASHKKQLYEYGTVLNTMGYHVLHKIIVYLATDITLEYI